MTGRDSSPTRALALSQWVNATGDGVFFVCSALYFTRVFGLSAGQAGLGLSIAWAVGSVTGLGIGRVVDRLGAKPAVVLLSLGSSVAVLLLTFADTLPVPIFAAFTLTAVLYATSQCGLVAARQALVAVLVPADRRTRVSATLQVALNAGLGLGAVLGGIALAVDTETAYRTVLLLDAASFLVTAAVLSRLPRTDVAPAAQVAAGTAALRDVRYVAMSLLNMLLLLRMPLLSVLLPLWIAERTDAPLWVASVLFALNTVGVMAFQVLAARSVRDVPTAIRALRRSGLLLALSCPVFALSASGGPWFAVGALVLATAINAAGELYQSVGSWQLSFDLATEGRHGGYQAVFNAGTSVARSIGPALLVLLLIEGGTPGWWALGVVFVVAAWLIGPVVSGRPGVPAPEPAPSLGESG